MPLLPPGELAVGPLTRETPAPGLSVWQPRRGHRYAMDPFLLGGFALEGGWPRSFLEVGCGSGVLTLLLARLGLVGRGIDVRPEWVALARRSAAESGLSVSFEQADVRGWEGSPVELVLANPPYRPLGQGPLPPDPLRAAARHELHGGLGELVLAMARFGPRVALVLPRLRADEAEGLLQRAGRPLVRRCEVGAALVLLEGREGGGPRSEEAIEARPGGEHHPRVRAWYATLGATLP